MNPEKDFGEGLMDVAKTLALLIGGMAGGVGLAAILPKENALARAAVKYGGIPIMFTRT